MGSLTSESCIASTTSSSKLSRQWICEPPPFTSYVTPVMCRTPRTKSQSVPARARPDWNEYLEESERNREARASPRFVRDQAQNVGQSIRVLRSRRIVMAFDPAVDDPNLLRTVVMLLRTMAITAAARHDADEIATAEEKVTEAIELLSRIDDIQKTAGANPQERIEDQQRVRRLSSGIERLLTQALAALAGAEVEVAPVVGGAPQVSSRAA